MDLLTGVGLTILLQMRWTEEEVILQLFEVLMTMKDPLIQKIRFCPSFKRRNEKIFYSFLESFSEKSREWRRKWAFLYSVILTFLGSPELIFKLTDSDTAFHESTLIEFNKMREIVPKMLFEGKEICRVIGRLYMVSPV